MTEKILCSTCGGEMDSNHLGAHYFYADCVEHLKSEIASLNAANEWVSVSERLPEVKGEYLCYLKPDIFISFYGDSWSGDLAFRSVIAPTHWQPLPTPPTEGE
jgi:hypothetical protein